MSKKRKYLSQIVTIIIKWRKGLIITLWSEAWPTWQSTCCAPSGQSGGQRAAAGNKCYPSLYSEMWTEHLMSKTDSLERGFTFIRRCEHLVSNFLILWRGNLHLVHALGPCVDLLLVPLSLGACDLCYDRSHTKTCSLVLAYWNTLFC